MDRQSEDLVSRLVGQMQQRNLYVCLPVPAKVVVELHADGLVKVYGPKHVQVAIMQRPVETAPQLEALVDEYIEVFLPPGFKSVYWPSNLVSQQKVERVAIKELAKRLAQTKAKVDLLKAIDKIAAKLAPDG